MTARTRLVADLSLRVTTPGKLAASIAVASTAGVDAERFTLTAEAEPASVVEVVDFPHGTRVHLLDLPRGDVRISYEAEHACRVTEAEPVTAADHIRYTRPSRYCPSDRLLGFAGHAFGRCTTTVDTVRAIVDHVADRIGYVPGSSRSTDGALDTLLGGEGVCRDFAHLCVAFCRARDIPARFAAVYAPGLSPMDFHAVFEAAVDGRWYVFDATRMAPRQSLTRIATGRDAADTAFLTTLGSDIELRTTSVTATVDPELPTDDGEALVALA
ncbi:Transglutaminase-like superfamily protein [Amycolatopsis arida]|uniref:Transglutaminase-like superfamily protein n=1 Tax=Amycolatopsis arida TaxID=587909 RepID=A0A1I5VQT3_9PSEU|nr:transglutaminase family protein [Amycolatopsis arida]TDX87991.1 transglutaminase superfamily protein [Amycolatopsis arida]SFQ09918.1 Transglutaminase-like superfamily protein [Amycolatopsis arida]